MTEKTDPDRRRFLAGLAAGSAVLATGAARASSLTLPVPPSRRAAAELAGDEAFWREVASYYDQNDAILNLEHGYWARMAKPVEAAYRDAIHRVNVAGSWYARREFAADEAEATHRIAELLGAHDDEIVITRNATEATQNLLRQYRGLEAGDAVLCADIDYPAFKAHMRWLREGRGVKVIEIALPSRASTEDIREAYIAAFEANPELRLMLVTHVSNQHGLAVPVTEITREARQRGIDVVCDAAQSWGLLDFRIDELEVDWAAFNLHKWIGAPLGTGALYMRRGTLDKVAPYPGESPADEKPIASRIHSGTFDFAARLAIPAALDFHAAVGPANKEARLRYLRSLWTSEAERMSHIELLGGTDETAWSGIGSFRLVDKSTVADAKELQQRLEQDFGIFTVIRNGLQSGSCVRITPQVYTTPGDIARLVDALRALAV